MMELLLCMALLMNFYWISLSLKTLLTIIWYLLEDAELIVDIAPFDIGVFTNQYAFTCLNMKGGAADYSTVFDTLPFARKKHPGARASLDTLCKR